MGQHLSFPNATAFLYMDSVNDAAILKCHVNRLTLLKAAWIGVANDAASGVDTHDANWNDTLLFVASNQLFLELLGIGVGATAEQQWNE